MLTKEQKEQIEKAAVLQVRASWGGLIGSRIRGAMDDIRAKVVEEPWFGRATTGSLNDYSYLGHPADKASIADLYGKATEITQASWDAVFGKTDAAQIYGQDARRTEQERDGPEAGG